MSTVAERGIGEHLVLDASAVLAFLMEGDAPLEDGLSDFADRMSRAHLAAPSVLPFEVANVLRRWRNAGMLPESEAVAMLRDFMDLPIELWPWDLVADRAWNLGTNLTSYDAAYVALAELIDATLVTGDRKLAAAPGIRCSMAFVAAEAGPHAGQPRHSEGDEA